MSQWQFYGTQWQPVGSQWRPHDTQRRTQDSVSYASEDQSSSILIIFLRQADSNRQGQSDGAERLPRDRQAWALGGVSY
jgi:hypothetical protein